MKAKEGVLDYLNQILTAGLTAIHQYLLHSGICGNWGYERLEHEFHQ
ncbi:MAG: ferritin-like domain-containing protein [Nitrospirota bacterium]